MNFKISIDKKILFVNNNMSILQACESINLNIPRFCYHERLSVAGNCRMCLVEIEKSPKLVASCAVSVSPGMIIYTNSLSVKKAREGILEFLLLNHPLDCAICDQAGECDLQDQTMIFGTDKSKFHEYKRAVEDIKCSPLIKTIMTRCIHCTRCIRFANEILGFTNLGSSGRGNNLSINFYIKKLFKSEFSGNIIDLCPVGALTSKPYSFLARPWELKSIESIDTFDAVGSNIRIDIKGYEILRILPRLNEKINEEWISDKTRFAFDGLKRQRLYEPLLRQQNNKFKVISWNEALNQIISQFKAVKASYQVAANFGPQTDLEAMFIVKYLIEHKQGVFLNSEKSTINLLDFNYLYSFNSTINNLDQSDVCLFLGINPRLEAAIINLRFRKRYLKGHFKVASFGSALNLSFPVYNFGSNIRGLLTFFEGKHPFCEHFIKAKNPVIIIGKSFLQSFGQKQSILLFNILIKNTNLMLNFWKGLNFLFPEVHFYNQSELGISLKKAKFLNLKLIFCLGDSLLNLKHFSKDSFIVYNNHHGNSITNFANLILPTASFIEKNSVFVNIEGRYQKTKSLLFGPGSSKADKDIFFELIQKLQLNDNQLWLVYSAFNQLITNKKKFYPIITYNQDFLIKSKIIIKNSFFPNSKIENFYCNDSISNVSINMIKCSKTLLEKLPFIQ